MNNEKKKVVIYVRTKINNGSSITVEEQLSECYKYCAKNNFIVVGEYIDVAKSIHIEDRPNFVKMIEDSNNKEFEGVIVYRFDRFSRNRYESAIYKTKLKNNGVKLYVADTNISDDASGILMESVLEGFIEYLSESKGHLEKILKQQGANLNNEQ